MYILNPPAAELAERLVQVAAEAASDVHINFSVGTHLPLGINVNGGGADIAQSSDFLAGLERLAGRTAIEAANARIHRPGYRGADNFDLRYEVSGGIGRFRFENVDEPNRALAFHDSLARHFPLVTEAEATATKLDAATAGAIEFRQQTVAQLQVQVAELGKILATEMDRQKRHVEEIDAEYKTAYTARQQELESQVAAERSALEEQRKQFAAKVAEFETNEAKYMRRKLMVDARNEANQAKKIITEPTRKMRRGIHAVFLTVLALAATGAAFYVRRILLDQTFDWHYAAAAGAFSATFVSFAIYYIRWNDQWAGDHARHEFTNRQFNLDLLRASWLAELLFEWDEEQKTKFPPELIAAFAHSLFKPHGTKQAEHPVEQIAGMMGDISTLKVGKSGFEIVKGNGKPEADGKAK